MKKLSLVILLAVTLLSGCETTPKVDTNGNPPPGWRLTPKMPVAF